MARLPGPCSPVLSDRSAAAPVWQRSVSLPGSPPERSAASRAGEPSCQPSDPTPKRRSGRPSRDTKDSDRPIQSPGSAVPLKQSRNPQEPRTTREGGPPRPVGENASTGRPSSRQPENAEKCENARHGTSWPCRTPVGERGVLRTPSSPGPVPGPSHRRPARARRDRHRVRRRHARGGRRG